MKSVVASAIAGLTLASAASVNVEKAFEQFIEKYGKKYSESEKLDRLEIFAENLMKISKENDAHLLKSGEAVFGITQFMDLSAAEFKSMYLTYKPAEEEPLRVAPARVSPLADAVDWRLSNATSPVKDQGRCGSCWAFSATEAIESAYYLANNKMIELSPQQINSCDKVDGGCNGGNTETAYKYVMRAGGLTTEEEYPYTSGSNGKTGSCNNDVEKVVSITGFTSIKKGEKNLKEALNTAPVSVCVAAEAFQLYSGGILNSCEGRIDHCVQAVGYNEAEQYWIVRNSWGTAWGEAGHIRVAMGDNLCHIADDVTWPTL